MVAQSVIIASEVTGFISFFFTLLTWLGVYISLIIALRTAPQAIPLELGNLRQELMEERSMLKQRLKEGDRWHVFHGRQMRRIGKNESHIRLIEQTLKTTWKEFRALERRFLIDNQNDDLEDVKHHDSSSGNSEDEKKTRPNSTYHEKGRAAARVRDARRMRRRVSHLKSWTGISEAGLSIDNSTYYNTDFSHRLLWWWKQDTVRNLAQRVQRLQIRRIERDIYESDELTKRTLLVLGGMTGDDVVSDPSHGGPHGPNNHGGGGGGTSQRRRSRLSNRTSPRTSRPNSRGGVREVYEREIRRVRRSPSRSVRSRSTSPAPSVSQKVTSSAVGVGRRRDSVRHSRAPSVEYEVVDPGRIWVDVQNPPRIVVRDSDISRRTGRPQPLHQESYVRRRPDTNQ